MSRSVVLYASGLFAIGTHKQISPSFLLKNALSLSASSFLRRLSLISAVSSFEYKSAIVPNFLIGDFDSANSSAVDWAQKMNVQVEKYPVDKDFTDIQLGLIRATEIFGEHTAILTGAFGNGRFDHVYSTIFTCAAIDRKIFLADEREIIFYIKDGESVDVKFFQTPLAVSLLPVTNICEGVTTKNLHWELYDATLTQNFPNAVSNRVVDEKISVKINFGTLAVYFCFAE